MTARQKSNKTLTTEEIYKYLIPTGTEENLSAAGVVGGLTVAVCLFFTLLLVSVD
jgi:hypothetical protein